MHTFRLFLAAVLLGGWSSCCTPPDEDYVQQPDYYEEAGTVPTIATGYELRPTVAKMYLDREPRFYASVGYNGARWNCTSATGDGSEVVKNQQVWYYRGSKDGRSNNSERWLATGIGIKKYIHPSDCYVNNGTALPKVEPALRYADILISYAEALNNIEEGNNYQIESWDGSTTYTCLLYTSDAADE